MSQIAANAAQVQARIAAAARRAGRSADEVTLVAVTKTHPLDVVVEAYQAGLRHFGENRAAEGGDKVAAFQHWLQSHSADADSPHWHFIGHIQSRQAGGVLAGGYNLIHSVDSLKLAQRFNRLAAPNEPPLNVLLQCNVSGEASKSGFELQRWQRDANQLRQFLADASQIEALEKVNIVGLMTMAFIADSPEETRPTFQSLAALRAALRREAPHINWQHLSMGMTDDFEVAIEEGATIVRVGRAIFGEREL
ncbi:MAG: YggS family pyridoxal phosphate-dependent enzyme [Anaerolineae bacterium]